ncbi:MAG: RNA 2',3'-cyclic phosphodiesterase [Bryobacteraceae bacterium]
MRLFTGLSLPPQARAPLLALTDHLRPLADLAWTPEAKLHITTKFIGVWPDARLAELQQVLTAVATSGPVDIHIRGLGWMPNSRAPLTLYAGVELTGDLASRTEDLLEGLGILKEKRAYQPHVTLGRIRRTGGSIEALRAEIELAGIEIAPFRADAFHLYLSDSGTYTKLSDYPLPT